MGITRKSSSDYRTDAIRNCVESLSSMSKELDMISQGCYSPSVVYKEPFEKNGLQGVLRDMDKSMKKVERQIKKLK